VEPGFPMSVYLQGLIGQNRHAQEGGLGRTARAAAAQSTDPTFAARHAAGGALRRRALARATLQRVLHRHLPVLYATATETKCHTRGLWLDVERSPEIPDPRGAKGGDWTPLEAKPAGGVSFGAWCLDFVRNFPMAILEKAVSRGEGEGWVVDPEARLARMPTEEALTAEWRDVLQREEAAFSGFRAMQYALSPLIEALILLDRALFLLESAGAPQLEEREAGVRVRLFPLFDPAISPRNMALYAWRE